MALHAVGRWVRRNALLAIFCAAVVGALLATVAVVRSGAADKDRLRQAQNAVVLVPSELSAVATSPQSLLAGQPAAPAEFPLNKSLRDALAKATLATARLWPNQLGREIRDEAARVNAATATMMGLIGTHDLTAANALFKQRIKPLVDSLDQDASTAASRLTRDISGADRTTGDLTLAVVAVAGLLLMTLMSLIAVARRRGARTRTERERAEVESRVLRETSQRLETLVENGSDMITVLDRDATVIFQAGAVQAMLGHAPAMLAGTKLTEWIEPQDVPALLALCTTRRSARQELRMLHGDGRNRICEASATSLVDHPIWGDVVVLNIWDVTERKVLEERLRHQAFHDELTGLPNRALGLDRAQQMLARARREHTSVIALYVDLDGFKHINDSFGHAAGDELLRVVAARLSRVTRETDVVARFGGDEFIVLVDGSTLDVAAELVAERLMAVLSEPIELEQADGQKLSIGASVGIATGQQGSADELLRDADLALYQAKDAGKSRYQVFESSMQSTASERMHLAIDLREAIDNDELFLVYQPTFDLRSETVTGVEALVRWQHPTRGVLAPDRFINLAEETGLIGALGRWVLDNACSQASAWHAAGHTIGIAVNVSARQLERDDFVDDVRGSLERCSIDPGKLTLEITETTLMRDTGAAVAQLQSLKSLGVRIAIDDFGTGYSSLAYLRKFPIDALKIDRSFVADIADSAESAALVHTLVQLGKTLGLQTLGEGIEDKAQLHKLQQQQCDFGQGFLLARPLSVEAVQPFLELKPAPASQPGLVAAAEALAM